MHASVYKRQLEQHHQHWWFKSRRSILQAVIKKNFHENIRILDFGCGVGNNLEMLSNFGIVYAFDKKKSILNLLKKNFYTNKKIKFIKKLNNYKNYFDLIVVTDVIEHIENDEKILSFLTKLLKNPIIKNSKHKNLKLFEQKKERERERERERFLLVR
jgi:2-polyprenyl-3-methyl-5-hydroxy-6-metoxy-1,4-benzoquinol methylase